MTQVLEIQGMRQGYTSRTWKTSNFRLDMLKKMYQPALSLQSGIRHVHFRFDRQAKGVLIEHRGMLNHLYAKINDLRLTETDSVAQTASQCFDISVWQMLICWVSRFSEWCRRFWGQC